MNRQKIIQCLCCLAVISTRVFACTTPVGGNPNLLPERQNEVLILLAISLFFAIATSFLYFKKNKQVIIAVVVSILAVVFTTLTSSVYNGDCGERALYNTKVGISISFVCFVVQFTIWLMFRKKSYAELS